MAAQARLLTIAPHVGKYAADILASQGVKPPDQDFLAPVAPVTYPEECGMGHWQDHMPPCERAKYWLEQQPPRVLAGTLARFQAALRGEMSAAQLAAAQRAAAGRPPPRDGFCIQGKLDPSRRSYGRIFAEMLAHQDAIRAANLTVRIIGKGGGKHESSLLTIPQQLLDSGLVEHYDSLPFQASKGGWGGRRLRSGEQTRMGRRAAAANHCCCHRCCWQTAGVLPPRRSTTSCCTAVWRWCPPLRRRPTTSTRLVLGGGGSAAAAATLTDGAARAARRRPTAAPTQPPRLARAGRRALPLSAPRWLPARHCWPRAGCWRPTPSWRSRRCSWLTRRRARWRQ